MSKVVYVVSVGEDKWVGQGYDREEGLHEIVFTLDEAKVYQGQHNAGYVVKGLVENEGFDLDEIKVQVCTVTPSKLKVKRDAADYLEDYIKYNAEKQARIQATKSANRTKSLEKGAKGKMNQKLVRY